MEVHIQPLSEVFGEMEDPREWHWHDLGVTLTLIFMAVVSGENGLRGIAAWLQERRWQLGKRLGLRGSRVPSYGTIRRVLLGIDLEDLERRLSRWAEQFCAAMQTEAWAGIAIDGKTVRGSAPTREDKAVHLLSAFSHQLEVVLGQRAVPDATNEIPEVRALLETLVLEGKLVTLDAMHTQRETAQVILQKGGPT
ncbi:MAG: hypothetical protein Kow00120_10880 [Anaerolineae bacterium]